MSLEREGESFRWVGFWFVSLPCRFFRAELDRVVSVGDGPPVDYLYFQARSEEEAVVFAERAARGMSAEVVQVEEGSHGDLFCSERSCYVPNMSERLALGLARAFGDTSNPSLFLQLISP